MTTKRNAKGEIEFWNKAGQLTGVWAGVQYSDLMIFRLAAKRWGDGWRAIVATAICIAESNGFTECLGDIHLADSKWLWSEGLMQMRVTHSEKGRYLNPESNFDGAWKLWDSTKGWKRWGAFKNLSYLKYMNRARKARVQFLAEKVI